MRARLEQPGPSIAPAACGGKKIGILVVAYNAVTTLTKVLRRIPADAWENVAEVVVFDDASQDSTYELAVGFKTTAQVEKLNVIRNLRNLGYGGNQKAGYRYFIERGFDIVVLLHGDGQYAPEALAAMYGPLVNGEAEAVFGSRMLKDYGGPLKGGMPLYKYAGNRILTALENAALGMRLSEFHSGYRAYDLHALAEVDFSAMTDDFHFDTEIIIKLNHLGFRIKEVPIPTYYGDEICYVNGMKYAGNVVRSVYRYRQTVRAIRPSPEYREFWVHYPVKESRYSSHYYLRQWAGTGHRILDIGCGEGFLSAEVARMGNRVTGVDILPHPRAEAELEQYVECDLAGDVSGPFARLRGPYDKILLMDVLEHLPRPERMLEACRPLLAPHGQMIVSIPNIANITTRLLLLAGHFDYTEKGLLDRTHLRFFTRKTARRLLEENSYEIIREVMTNIPVELGLGLAPSNRLVRAMHRVLRVVTRIFGGLFGYQTMLTARKRG
jgi:2-polyprenyl-3-methyl-5-hydroxy-6-metoxy-1,4-benzoquinol methylase